MNQPDYENLIRLVKLIGGKFVIVEDGRPIAILMDYKEFQDLVAPVYADKLTHKVEEINREITAAQMQDLREEVIAQWPAEPPEGLERNDEEIRIEPLTG